MTDTFADRQVDYCDLMGGGWVSLSRNPSCKHRRGKRTRASILLTTMIGLGAADLYHELIPAADHQGLTLALDP